MQNIFLSAAPQPNCLIITWLTGILEHSTLFFVLFLFLMVFQMQNRIKGMYFDYIVFSPVVSDLLSLSSDMNPPWKLHRFQLRMSTLMGKSCFISSCHVIFTNMSMMLLLYNLGDISRITGKHKLIEIAN